MSSDAERERLRPTDGARYLLERRGGEDGAAAVYDAWIIAPAATWPYTVEVAAGGEPVLAGEAPAGLEKQLRAFAKVLARDGAPWPARLLRWRAATQSSSSP